MLIMFALRCRAVSLCRHLLGYCTAKGELVSGILFPKPLDLKFYQDSIKFILFLALMASLGMIYSLIMYIRHNVSMVQFSRRPVLSFAFSILFPYGLSNLLCFYLDTAHARFWLMQLRKCWCLSTRTDRLIL